MAKKITYPIRSDPTFKRKFIDDIKLKRQLRYPKERLKPIKSARITLAMNRHPLMRKVKRDIIEADLI